MNKNFIRFTFIICVISLFLTACGSSPSEDTNEQSSPVTTKVETDIPKGPMFKIDDEALWSQCQELYANEDWDGIMKITSSYSTREKAYSSEIAVMYYLARSEKEMRLNGGTYTNNIPLSYDTNGIYGERVAELRRIYEQRLDELGRELTRDARNNGTALLFVGDPEYRMYECYGDPERSGSIETADGVRYEYMFTDRKTGRHIFVFTDGNKVTAIDK